MGPPCGPAELPQTAPDRATRETHRALRIRHASNGPIVFADLGGLERPGLQRDALLHAQPSILAPDTAANPCKRINGADDTTADEALKNCMRPSTLSPRAVLGECINLWRVSKVGTNAFPSSGSRRPFQKLPGLRCSRRGKGGPPKRANGSSFRAERQVARSARSAS